MASEVAWIRGGIGLRGKIIPIFDLAVRLDLAGSGSEPGKIVIVETGTSAGSFRASASRRSQPSRRSARSSSVSAAAASGRPWYCAGVFW